jgi:hypothetical protein
MQTLREGRSVRKLRLLPSKNEGIRKMIVNAKGRLSHMDSHNGKLGVTK